MREAAARAVVAAGVAVMGHCGLLPQSISVLGGFRPQGQSAAEALRVVREARVRHTVRKVGARVLESEVCLG